MAPVTSQKYPAEIELHYDVREHDEQDPTHFKDLDLDL